MNNSNNNVDKALQDLSSPSAEELNNQLIGTQIKFTIGYFCFVALTLIALGLFNLTLDVK